MNTQYTNKSNNIPKDSRHPLTIFLISSSCVLLLFLFWYVPAKGEDGCMECSYHGSNYDCFRTPRLPCVHVDYKTPHYVRCNCPCHKYPQDCKRGICTNCGHYHVPKHLPVVFK